MNIQFASLTDVGVKRSHNQDACATQPAADERHWRSHGHVFIVADGMGGHAVGEKASAKAIRDIPLTYLKHVAAEGAPAAIRRAFVEANDSIHQIGVNNPEFKGLGTTGTALVLRPEGAWVGHVGDSRAYRIRGGRVQQLTFDHSWVWEVARRQGIDPDDLGDFKRNVIIRSLGPDPAVEVDVEGPHPVEPGDTFLLCSDGLTNEVTAEELGAVASAFPPAEAAQYLVDLANIRGGRDNITCLIVQSPLEGSTRHRLTNLSKPLVNSGFVRRLRRTGRGVSRVVPWPFLALLAGAFTASGSVWLQSEGLRGLAIPAFALSVALIFTGLVGLYLHLARRGDSSAAESADPDAGGLHLYRDYPFAVAGPLVQRFTELHSNLLDACKSRDDLGIDWPRHDQLAATATERAAKSDWPAAFAARFRALQLLAVAYNQARQKDEGFQPKWT